MNKSWLIAVGTCVALAGCGGGGGGGDDNPPPPTDSVPASASASVGGFVGYLQKLVVATADMLEPVDASALAAPSDDTAEPTAVD